MTQPNGFAVGPYGFPTRRIGFYVDDSGNLYQVTQNSTGQQVVINLSAGGGGGGGTWGSITGTLSNQTDLQTALTAATAGATWGSITGSLSGQSDLQTALNGKQSTTYTIAGATDFVSATLASSNTSISTALAGKQSTTYTLAGATDFVSSSLATSNTSIVNGLAAAAAGGAPVAWQTYTPNVTNTVHIALDRSSGVNVLLNAPVDNTQVVDVPLNMADGQEMQINLVGGGGSGSWTAWSSGSPSTAGFYPVSGVMPTAPTASTNCLEIFIKRRGAKYVLTTGYTETV